MLWLLTSAVNLMPPRITWEKTMGLWIGTGQWTCPWGIFLGWVHWTKKTHPERWWYRFLGWALDCIRIDKTSWVPGKPANKDPCVYSLLIDALSPCLDFSTTVDCNLNVQPLCPKQLFVSRFYHSHRNETRTEVKKWSLGLVLAVM